MREGHTGSTRSLRESDGSRWGPARLRLSVAPHCSAQQRRALLGSEVPRGSLLTHSPLPSWQPRMLFSLSPQFCLFQGGVTELGSQSTRPFQIDLLHSPLLGSRPALNPVSTSRSQMRTAQHEELRRPARCHTASKWRSSGSSLGPVLIHHAPGVRDDARHPGTNSPSRPFLEAGRRGPPAAWGRTGSGSLPIPGGSLTCPRPGW